MGSFLAGGHCQGHSLPKWDHHSRSKHNPSGPLAKEEADVAASPPAAAKPTARLSAAPVVREHAHRRYDALSRPETRDASRLMLTSLSLEVIIAFHGVSESAKWLPGRFATSVEKRAHGDARCESCRFSGPCSAWRSSPRPPRAGCGRTTGCGCRRWRREPDGRAAGAAPVRPTPRGRTGVGAEEDDED